MSNGSLSSPKDRWDKWESLSKIIGGVSIPLIGIIVTVALQRQADSAKKSELYASVMTERENADSTIRAKMFDSLMSRYFSVSARAEHDDVSEFADEITTLELLLGNFQEYFDAEPLFYRLHDRILANARRTEGEGRGSWEALDARLIKLAMNTSDYQAALLGRVGFTIDQVLVPLSRNAGVASRSHHIALYSLHGLTNVDDFYPVIEPVLKNENVANDSRIPDVRYSVVIEVHTIEETEAGVSVFLWKDDYIGSHFEPSKSNLIRKIDFNVSYFGSPYMDNTLISGSRFALIYKGCIDMSKKNQECEFPLNAEAPAVAHFQILTFSEQFLSQRDRPYLDQILQQAGQSRNWW